ncbi:hypothetical protein BFU36_01040 [Sulfolobus sp. A20]|uniref:hypothetical protein n=1 Tax=Sulfolobaceae TaxID=118883 RepID=UPI000845C7B4|nr:MULTISPECIES: hypothetical protein [unclassified Sulfolobus]TRM75142.1 hypothetical protein DJ528_09655 [Sulfolobus sp. B5]TRM77031.1 hypothetical protein DJ532_06050 [Sulfolobus sp. A20-N-F8]TRM81025.1 hypothetical protein DJ524_05585 [Sulfolobus sp. D5]TRM83759.1 hypothetical protein DJ531_03980 [Sulfolobus sp. A20-N-F6]AOL15551.1 hypothetical protein BFU36_01040 [Sulfolobus sp. A20]
MKVVKYHLKAKVERTGKDTITIERNFRELINARKFIDELVKEADVKCTPLNRSENLITKQCEGNGVKYFFEIGVERIKKPKKETKKEEKKQTEEKSEEKTENQNTQQ